MELGQGGEVMDRSVMIIVLGIVANFCRQRHHQWHKRQSCFSFDTSLVELNVETRTSFSFGRKLSFATMSICLLFLFIHICLCASTRVSHITPFFELSYTLLTTHALGLYIQPMGMSG